MMLPATAARKATRRPGVARASRVLRMRYITRSLRRFPASFRSVTRFGLRTESPRVGGSIAGTHALDESAHSSGKRAGIG